MSALAMSAIIFVLSLGGIFLGTQLRRTLPEHHLDEHAKDVVRLGVGLIATIAALVLGLLIAAAKASFDTQSTHLKHITANLILLDNILAQYGPEARSIREQMRSAIGPFADRLWREKETGQAGPFETEAPAETDRSGDSEAGTKTDRRGIDHNRPVLVRPRSSTGIVVSSAKTLAEPNT
jgi:hypothetical protein